MQKFTTLAELSRQAGIPANRITSAVEAGVIHAAGRAGSNHNSPIIFLTSDLPSIIEALKASGRMKAMASVTNAPHRCSNASEVLEKAAALDRARKEAGK